MTRSRRDPRSRTPFFVVALAAALVLPPPAVHAQAPTGFTSAGYGALGAAAGALAGLAVDSDCSGFVCIPAGVAIGLVGGGISGAIVGYGVASEANAQIAAGQPLSSGRRFAVGLGATLGGAVIGSSLTGVVLGNSGAGGAAVAVGAGIGVAWAVLSMRDMAPGDPEAFRLTPTADLEGRVGVNARLSF